MTSRYFIVVLLLVLQAACSSTSWQEPRETHIVRRGETLFAIAWRYGKSADDIARWNRLGDGSLIYPGQVLQLSGPARVARNSRAAVPPSRTTSPPKQSAPPPRSLPAIPAEPPPAWRWPVAGRVNVAFGQKPGTGTGVLIDGKAGLDIRAAANGRVVYAGEGLIGYGKLIILKHNATYLSAYGYNATLLVKEGEQISQGQTIATMGEGPERKPRLHFEIRRNGEPVDPKGYLPAR